MDLVGMATFARVVQTGSFSRAAQRLTVSKSVVSKRVADLERALGSQLLLRTTRNLSVTEAGREFYERCAQMLEIAEQAEAAASRLQSEPRGTLRVVAPVSFGSVCVARLLPRFLAANRNIAVDLVLTNHSPNLIEEGFDASIVIRNELPPGMVARCVSRVRQRACASPSYLALRGAPTTPADLVAHNCLLFTNGLSERHWRFRSPEGVAVSVAVSGNLQINNASALRFAAREGGGVALLPEYIVASDIARGTLVAVLPDWIAGEIAVHVVFPPARRLAAKVRALVDFLVAEFAVRTVS